MRLAFLRVFYWGTVFVLLLPIALMVLLSVKSGSIASFPLGSPSLRWYAALLDDREAQAALTTSVTIALASTLLAGIMGLWCALLLEGVKAPTLRLLVFCGAMVPLVTPGIIHAIALRIAIRGIGLDPGPLAVTIGHAIHAAPYVVIMVAARLATLPPSMAEAARDLGARPWQCLVYVTLPWLAPAILGSAILSLLTSFDDFVRSFFLGGYHATLPVLIYGRLHGGFTPEINALSTLVQIIAGLAGIAAASWLPTGDPGLFAVRKSRSRGAVG